MNTFRPTGTQSIERAVLLLKEIAARGTFGWGLSDLASRCNLDKGTAHRILASLIRERLVQKHATDRRYLPGPLLFELSLSMPGYAAFQKSCQAPLNRIANQVGGLAYLYLHSGTEVVVAAHAGRVPIRGLSIELGVRRPMIMTAGGVSILLALPAADAAAIINQNKKQVASFGEARVRSAERIIRRSRSNGFGISESDIVSGTTAVGVPVRDTLGVPFAAICAAGPAECFPTARISGFVELLREEGRRIELAVARLPAGPTAAPPADRD